MPCMLKISISSMPEEVICLFFSSCFLQSQEPEIIYAKHVKKAL